MMPMAAILKTRSISIFFPFLSPFHLGLLSAAAKPATVFPTLLTLAQAHLKKLDGEGSKVFYNKLIGQIIDNLEDEFPPTLPLADQGKFIIGYYQQTQEFFRKKEDREEQ